MVGTVNSKKKNIHESITELNETDIIEYDSFLSAAGEFGLYQIIMFFCTGPFYICGAFVYFSQLFMTEVSPNHWCWIPELQNLTDIKRRNLAIPTDLNTRFGYSHCRAYDVNWTEVLRAGLKPNSSWPTMSCQNGWEFNKTEIPYPTVSSDMGWVCERNSNQATAQSIFFIGSILGGFLIGWVADRYGRLSAASCSNIIGCLAGVGSTYAQSFADFAVCRFFVGMSYDNCMMMTYLLILESTSSKYRTLMANLSFAIFFTIGLTSLPWIALASGHWKVLGLATSVPLALAIFAYFLLPESPSWLLSKGKVEEAIKNITTIAKVNKKQIPPKIIQQFKITVTNTQITSTEKANLINLMKRPLLRQLFICICIEYMCCMMIFDVSARTVGQLQFDLFLSFTLVSLTEFPSLVLVSLILDLVGRRWLTIVVISICGIFSFLTAFVPSGLPSVMCAIVSRFTVNMAANTAMQWCAEMLPTPVRGSGAAFIHICGYVANVISPFVAHLDVVAYWLPFVISGSIAGLCVVLAFLLPETAKKEMPQTFEAAENLMRDKRLLDFPWSKNYVNNGNGQVNASFEMN